MASKVRVGIIGCGPKGAQVMYAPIWRYLRDIELKVVWDPNSNNAQKLCQLIGEGKVVTNLEAIWGSDIDAVIISSPVWAHAAQAIVAFENGLHVFCEKPMARSVQECRAMISAANNSGKILMLGFMKRYDKSFLKAAEMLRDGDLGKLIEVRCDWSFSSSRIERVDDSREMPETWGGVFQDHGSHTIDLCRWWLGDVTHVSGEIQVVDPTRTVEDHGSAVIRHVSGGTSVHTMSRVRHGPVVEKYALIGTEATLEIEFNRSFSYTSTDPFQMVLYSSNREQQDITVSNLPNLDDEIRKNGRYTRELQHFVDCINDATVPITSGTDGLRAIEAVTAAFYSSWTGRKIEMPFLEEFDFRRLFDDTRGSQKRAGSGSK